MTTYSLTGDDIADIVESYLYALLWDQLPLGGDHADDSSLCDLGWTVEDVAPEYVAAVREGITAFCEAHADDVSDYLTGAHCGRTSCAQLGYDLYMTRTDAGVGFWARDLGDPGDRLSDAAHMLGEVNALFDARESVPYAMHHGERVLIGHSPYGW